MRIAVVPDKFGGGLTAHEVANAISCGLETVFARDEITSVPLSDGGEGFLEVMSPSVNGDAQICTFEGWNGQELAANVLLADGVVYVEAAMALGREAMRASGASLEQTRSSSPLGSLLNEVLAYRCRKVIVGLGGTLCLDGGMALYDSLTSLANIEVVVACDLDITYTESARITGPTKHAPRDELDEISRELRRLLPQLSAAAGVDLACMPFAGAGGGCAAALAARGARLTSGAALVSETLSLRARVAGAACVVTAEGLVDQTSERGKLVGYLRRLFLDRNFKVFCRNVDRPVLSLDAFCTEIDRGPEYGALRCAAAAYANQLTEDTHHG